MPRAGAAVEGADQPRAPVAARHDQARGQQHQQRPDAGGADRGHRNRDRARRQRSLSGKRAGAMRRPQFLRHGIAAARHQPVVAFGDRPMRQAAVALQPPRGILPVAARRKSRKPLSSARPDGGDGGRQHQRLQQPGNEGEKPEQGQREIKADDADGGPQRRQHALDHRQTAPSAMRRRNRAPPRARCQPASQPGIWSWAMSCVMGPSGPHNAPFLAPDQDLRRGRPRIVGTRPSPRHRRPPIRIATRSPDFSSGRARSGGEKIGSFADRPHHVIVDARARRAQVP